MARFVAVAVLPSSGLALVIRIFFGGLPGLASRRDVRNSLYASLVGVNAYNQPGVEAGKKAGTAVLTLQRKLLTALTERGGDAATCAELVEAADVADEIESAFMVLERLAANPARGVVRRSGPTVFDARYSLEGS